MAWDYGDEGWTSLARLITECLRRVPESLILSHARGAIAPNVLNPLDVFCWRLHHKIMPLAPYTARRDVTKPAAHVLEADELETSAEGGILHQARQTAGHLGGPAHESSAAAELEASREKARSAGAMHKGAGDGAEKTAQEQTQARREHLAARMAALDEERAEMAARRRAAADPVLDGVVQTAAEQRAAQDVEQAWREEAALAEYGAKRRGPQFQTAAPPQLPRAEHGQDDEHAPAHAVAHRSKKAKQLLAQGFGQTETAPPAAAAEDEAPKQALWVADRLRRWASEGIIQDRES